jgi:hypothetical protein
VHLHRPRGRARRPERDRGEGKGIAYEVTRYGIDDLDRAIADGAAHGFVKVLTVPGKDRILGATIVGEHAGDLIAEFVLAMKHGLGLNKILGTIHIYPTLAEANKYAAGAWKRAHAPAARCCAGWSASTPGGAAYPDLKSIRDFGSVIRSIRGRTVSSGCSVARSAPGPRSSTRC